MLACKQITPGVADAPINLSGKCMDVDGNIVVSAVSGHCWASSESVEADLDWLNNRTTPWFKYMKATPPATNPAQYVVVDSYAVTSNIASEVYSVVTLSIEDTRLIKKTEIINFANTLRSKKVRGRILAEGASWFNKKKEADAYDDTPVPSNAPNLDTEATARGVALADLVADVIANANAYFDFEADVSGITGKHLDAVDAIVDPVLAITYDAYLTDPGWPAEPVVESYQ